MPALKIYSAEFKASCGTVEQFLKPTLPEVAIVGRSNVGKSSAINCLVNHKGLAKVGKTPGKTQTINFFQIETNGPRFMLVDLPGYGFAKVPKKQKEQWGKAVHTYLETRNELNLILFLIDIRRTPNDDDLKMMEWILHTNKAVILVITKADKIAKGQRKNHVDHILQRFNLKDLHYVLYSTPKKIGRDPLISLINEAIADEINDEGASW